jgi:alpha-N-arabinofuranosidase
MTLKAIAGRVLTAPAVNAHNTFAAPDVVTPQRFDGATLTAGGLRVTLPAKSVVVLEL